jgi:hypothetical protein
MDQYLKIWFFIVGGMLQPTGIWGQEFNNQATDTLKSENIQDKALVKSDAPLKIARNYFVFTFGFVEIVSAGYERNIIWKRGAQTNVRIGYGFVNDLQGGAHELVGTLVQLFGKRNSHLEVNLGFSIIQNVKDNMNPSTVSQGVYTYAGYRFEKPDGNFIFRAGLIYPIIYALELGIGFKF